MLDVSDPPGEENVGKTDAPLPPALPVPAEEMLECVAVYEEKRRRKEIDLGIDGGENKSSVC